MGSVQESSDIASRNILLTTQDVTDASNKNDGRDKADADGPKTSVMELFTWISEFKKMCRSSLSQRSMASLIQLINYYTRNVCQNVNECYTKPFRAVKLKESISEALLFFLYYCRELSEVQDRTVYLDKMSDLLSMYMDMELKASKTGKEHRSKITARLTSCLCVYLENSTEHLLNTLIKVRFMSRNYQDILDPIITKIFKSIPERPDSDLMYVRYLLAYRLWKKVNNDAAVKSQINVTAVSYLGQPPTALPSFLTKYVLPKVPKSQINSTRFLLLHKFDVEQSCRHFARYCSLIRNDDSRDKDMQTLGGSDMYKDTLRVGNSIDSRVSDKICETESKLSSVMISVGKGVTTLKESSETAVESTKEMTREEVTRLPVSRSPRAMKVLPRRKPKRKASEIVIIDLTSEEVSEVVIKKRKRKRLAWLKEATKRIDMRAVKAARKREKRKSVGTKVNGASDTILNSVRPLEDTFTFQLLSATEDSEPKDTRYPGVTSDSGIDGDKLMSSGCDLTSRRNSNPSIEEETAATPIDISIGNIPDAITSKVVIVDSISTDIPRTTSSSRDKESFSDATGYSTETVSEVSNALSNISKYYDSDSALEVSSDAHPDSSTASNYHNDNNQDKKSDTGLGSDSESERTKSIDVHEVSPGITKYLTEVQCSLNVSKNLRNAKDNVNNFSSKVELTDGEDQLSHFTESSIRFNSATRAEAMSKKENLHPPIVNSHNAKLPARDSCSAEESYELGADVTSIRNANEVKLLEEKLTLKRKERKVKIRTNETCGINEVSNDGKGRTARTNIVAENFTVSTITRHESPKEQQMNMDISSSVTTQATVDNSAQKISKERDSAYDSRFNGNTFSIESTEYQEHIDGLSLLASVSQQVPHLMARPSVINGSTEALLINRNIDDETVISDSSNTVIQFCENPPTKVINEIVGIYPEDALEKVALQVEVTSTEADSTENNSLSVVPIIMDSAADLSGGIMQNNMVSVESHGQSAKECTNVILNGETVVLLQKSPNSNLYIINKAVKNKVDLEEEVTTGARDDDKEEDSIKEENLLCSEVMETTSQTELAHNNRKLSWKENKSLQTRNKAVKVEPEDDNNSILYYEDPRYKSSYKYNSYRCEEELVKSDNKVVELSSLRHRDTTNSIIELKPTLQTPPPVIRLTETVIDNHYHQPGQAIYQDNISTTKKKSKDKRKSKVTSNTNLSCKTSVKQEFNACTNNASNHQTSDYGIQGCPVAAQHPLHIPVTHPTTLPSIYGAVSATTDLLVPYHKHCSSVPCGIAVNSPPAIHSHTKSASPATGRTHCTCLNCTYSVITHCPQCILPAADTNRAPYIQANSYFLPSHPAAVQASVVPKDDESKISDEVLTKLYDDQLNKIEKSIMNENPHQEADVKYRQELDNKLPLKKRLKAHAMMSLSYEDTRVKIEKLVNYPSTPMMSIAALEDQAASPTSGQDEESPIDPSSLEDESLSHYHNREMIRRDYCKDITHVPNGHHNHSDDRSRKHEHQRRQVNGQSNGCHQVCCQRGIKRSAQHNKDVTTSSPSSLKRLATGLITQVKPPKKLSTAQAAARRTRSSKRNVPKVNYSCLDVDPEWNPSGESKRRRKRTSR